MTYNADGTASRKLLDALGLPDTTPVVEWHSWNPGSSSSSTVEMAWNGTAGTSSLTVSDGHSVVGSGQVLMDGSSSTYVNYSGGGGGGASSTLEVPAVPVPSSGFTVYVDWKTTFAGTPAETFNVIISQGGYGQLAGWYYTSPGPVIDLGGGWKRFQLTLVDSPSAFAQFVNGGSASAIVNCLGPSGKVYEARLVVEWDPDTTPEGWALDPVRTGAIVEYQTTHGRLSPLDNVGPLTCSVVLARELLTDDVIPRAGERFRLTLNPDVATALGIVEAERPRFTGEVTDVDVTAEGVLSLVPVTGVGRRSRLGRVPLKNKRPEELDGKRVRRILYQAATVLPVDIGTIDPGTVTLLPADYSGGGTSAGAAVESVTSDTLGQLVEHRSGRLDWHDANHRRDRASLVSLAGPDHLIKPFRWSQGVGTVINVAEATYGPAEDRKVIRARDAASVDVVDGLGPYGAQFDTQLADASGANFLVSTVVARYGWPVWWLPALTVDVVRTAGSQAGEVLSLSHGDKITAAGLPPDGPFTAGDLFVEGTTESFMRTAWRVSVAVADPSIAGVGIRWVDVPPEVTWADVDPDLTWADAATIAVDDLTSYDVLDGGDASTTSWTLTLDGGDASAVHDTTYDGGTSS